MYMTLPNDLLWLCPVQAGKLIRLGCNYDGGYIVPEHVVEQCDSLLSLGLGNDWSFDEDWHKLKPETPIHMNDYGAPISNYHKELREKYQQFFHTNENIKHFDNFVAAETNPEQNRIGFNDCLDRLGGKNVFLKMDIEGGEFEILNSILENQHRILGVVIEIHFTIRHRDLFKQTVERFKEFYKIIHFHGNNHTTAASDCLTDCMEISFVRKDLVPSDELRYHVHIPGLDFSNVISLDDWQYTFANPNA